MKRFFSLLLCGVLCLSLTACGGSGNGNANRGEYDYLLELLDEHKYSEAVDYINRLAYDYAEENKGEQPDSPHLPALNGEWLPYNVSENMPIPPAFTFGDGKCTVDGKTYLVEIDSEDTNALYLKLLDGATLKYSFSLRKNIDNNGIGHYTASATVYEENNGKSLGSFYNPAHYEVVELSAADWDTYFESIDFYTYGKNSFDEVDSVNIHRQFRIKKEYYDRLWVFLTEVAVEYTSYIGKQTCEYDLDKQTCKTVGKLEPNQENGMDRVYTSSHKLGSWGDSSTPETGDEFYGYEYCSNSGITRDDGSQYFSWYTDNVNVTRVQGKLYLLKEEFQKMGITAE